MDYSCFLILKNMMMTTKLLKLITSDDPKGRQATDLFRSAYNKAQLTEEQAQHLNENKWGLFTKELLKLIQECSAINKGEEYPNEVIYSNYTYPKEYQGPRPIDSQIRSISSLFNLDYTEAIRYAKKLPPLPHGAEGWFAIPKVLAITKKLFPSGIDSLQGYNEAVRKLCSGYLESKPNKINSALQDLPLLANFSFTVIVVDIISSANIELVHLFNTFF